MQCVAVTALSEMPEIFELFQIAPGQVEVR